MSTQSVENKYLEFGKSEHGNFFIEDTIGVPHAYCIDSVHLKYNDSMYLDKEEKIKMEKDYPDKVMCDICKTENRKQMGKTILSYEEHETALLVSCLKNIHSKDGEKELHKYLFFALELT